MLLKNLQGELHAVGPAALGTVVREVMNFSSRWDRTQMSHLGAILLALNSTVKFIN